jgi:DNA polymerase-1
MRQTNTLLIDADIFCFQAASAVEEEIHWGDDLWTLHSDLGKAKAKVERDLDKVAMTIGGYCEFIICLTDKENFRKEVLPSYKENRKGKRKPIALAELKEWLASKYESFTRPTLEADDCMGILATWDAYKPGTKKIIVSEDKDMKTIPCYLFNPAKDVKVKEVTEVEADYYHFKQTLMGDTTDGYKGCPGIGEVGSTKVLDKGNTWDNVVSAFVHKGLTQGEALVQARVARICRASDYDFKKKEVILWTP